MKMFTKKARHTALRGIKPSEIAIFITAAVIISIFAFWVNRDIEIKGLYMDDLYMWSCYGEQDILEFIFPIRTSTRFRPVYWFATYLQMTIIGTHVDRFAAFNIVINIAAALEIFYISYRLSGRRPIGAAGAFTASLCYLASRFAYYQIGQALGLMETMALMMSLYILYELLMFSMKEAYSRGFYGALIMYFLVVFVHERYICLLPLFYLAIGLRLLKLEKSKRKLYFKNNLKLKMLMPLITLIIIIGIRFFAIGSALPAGTGGTEVTDTFDISEAFGFCIDQILYIFGVNAGPEYLNGIEWNDTPWQIKRTVKYSVLFIGLLCIMFALGLIYEACAAKKKAQEKEQGHKSVLCGYFSAVMMFAAFIALCIGSSSVTIRLEMRWIYVSYAAALIFSVYMIGALAKTLETIFNNNIKASIFKLLALVFFILYAVLSIAANIFYRGFFDKLYFWPDQLKMNSLAEETIEKYGTDGVFGKNIYILENTYGMSEFYAETFFKPYDPEKKAEGTNIIFIDEVSEIPVSELMEDGAIVLEEVPAENAYRDITGEIISSLSYSGLKINTADES